MQIVKVVAYGARVGNALFLIFLGSLTLLLLKLKKKIPSAENVLFEGQNLCRENGCVQTSPVVDPSLRMNS